jgi:PAS domain S-box-containing protein
MDSQARTEDKHYSQSGELLTSRAEHELARSECSLSKGRCAEEQHGKVSDQIPESDEQVHGRLTGVSKRLFSQASQIREAERALRESHDRLLSIVETANDPIIGADGLGNVIMWNSAATRTFGYSSEEVMNRPITILMPERFQELHEHAMQRAVAVGSLYYAKRVREVFGRKKDGTEFPVEVSISSWSTQQGMFFTGIVRDISERKRKDEELKEAYEGLELRVAERTAELVMLNENLK